MKLQLLTIVLSCVWLESCTSKSAAVSSGERPASIPGDVVVDSKTQLQLGVEVQPAIARSIAPSITATGQLQLNEDRTWRVGAVIEGRIVAVAVHLGDIVNAGQVLAQMHGHEVHDSRANLRQATAEMRRLKVMAEQSLRVLERTKRLFALKAASREQLEAAETQYESAQLSVLNAQAAVDKTEVHLTEFLDVPLEHSAQGEKANDGDRVPIKAPASGTVIERQANVGTVVSTGDPVITLSDLSSLWFIAAVNEADLSRIRRGQAVRIGVRAYPEKTFPGQVFELGERLDPETRTLQVRVLVSNRDGFLKPNMFATGAFTAPAQRAVVHVPESAIQELKGKPVVFVRTHTGSFAPREVKAGARVDRQVEILSGVEPGTPVVVNGALLLKSQLLKSEAN